MAFLAADFLTVDFLVACFLAATFFDEAFFAAGLAGDALLVVFFFTEAALAFFGFGSSGTVPGKSITGVARSFSDSICNAK